MENLQYLPGLGYYSIILFFSPSFPFPCGKLCGIWYRLARISFSGLVFGIISTSLSWDAGFRASLRCESIGFSPRA